MSAPEQYDVAVIGSRIVGYLCAHFLKVQQPDLRIAVIGPEMRDKRLPVVGESLTEFSTNLINRIGLADYLEREHYNKYGLTFYFKKDIDAPDCRTYSVHEAPAIPPMPSSQLNRFRFDKKLKSLAEERGIARLDGRVVDVAIDARNGHCLQVEGEDGTTQPIRCGWVVDCSGRSRVLAGHLGLKKEAPIQRSAYWFRLVNFDRSLLSKLDAVKAPHHCFDSYYVTHHFLSKGYWIWCIPMRDEEHEDMMSIGMIYRPDLQTRKISSVDVFKEVVRDDHPVIAELVDSGETIEKSQYRNYMYECDQLYSSDRWYIAGDAGVTVDPLYSTGIVMSCLQITQIEKIIARDRGANPFSKGELEKLESAFRSFHTFSQYDIGKLYEVIHDPYQASWRIHLASLAYFYQFLPMWLSGYMTDPKGAEIYARMTQAILPKKDSLNALIVKASEQLGADAFSKIQNRYNRTVNWALRGPCDSDIPGYLSRLMLQIAAYRLTILRHAGWAEAPKHLAEIVVDSARAAMVALLFRGVSLKSSSLFTRLLPKLDTDGESERRTLSQSLVNPIQTTVKSST